MFLLNLLLNMKPQQAYSETLSTKPSGRPLSFSKAHVKTLHKGAPKQAKPSNIQTPKGKFSRKTGQALKSSGKISAAFKNPMPKKGQPTNSMLGKVNQTV